MCRDIRNYIFSYFIPLIVINLRYLLVLLFLPMGILGKSFIINCYICVIILYLRSCWRISLS